MFGSYLKEKRILKGYSQRKLAKLANVSYTYISKLESDNVKCPGIEILARLSKILEDDSLIVKAGKMPTDLWEKLSNNLELVDFLRDISVEELIDMKELYYRKKKSS